jgi:lactam utilization protein B
MAMFSNGEDWTEASFTAAGVWTSSNVNIDPEKMPAALMATVKKANPGLEISGVNRLESAKGAPTYEIQLDSEEASYIAIYKADGTLVSKKQVEEESYDDEGDY